MNGTSKRARLLTESRWLVQTGAARVTEWIREWTMERRAARSMTHMAPITGKLLAYIDPIVPRYGT
ncbi:hypothetical protein HUB94_07885 [Paenibacillus cellulosilyticus]|uniref:hypothetical protein n=1 Tax=Paenibacillus cellulosilyticus TaxID=375489 RepID=UPI000D708E0E|nr:hypothetical protein [Paenibacillus cellulosilyticus]QKS44341.1 hypothetical protein HUB94_07885 [Paenibacillus cellulosilyticus]